MSTALPLLGDAMTALYGAFVAALEPTPPGEPGITITLGDAPSAAGDQEFIIVGHDGTLSPDGSLSEATEAGSLATKFVAMGANAAIPQEEEGTVNCVVVAQTGDSSDLAGRITEAQRLLAACEAASTNLTSGGILFGLTVTGRLWTRQATQGCAAEIAFQVTYSAPWD